MRFSVIRYRGSGGGRNQIKRHGQITNQPRPSRYNLHPVPRNRLIIKSRTLTADVDSPEPMLSWRDVALRSFVSHGFHHGRLGPLTICLLPGCVHNACYSRERLILLTKCLSRWISFRNKLIEKSK